MKRLAIITTHPIQYYAPVFSLLAKVTDLKVFYTWGAAALEKFDPGFGKAITWDIPILEGYTYEFLENIAQHPGSHHKSGIDNPHLIQKITDFRPQAILVYGYAYKSHLKVMRHFKGKIPIWFRGDSNLIDGQSRLKSLLKFFYLKWVYSYVDQAFYVGSANKAYFKKYGLKENQLVFAPHAIDNKRFGEDRKEEVERLRLSLGLSEKDILILYAGKLEAKKDPGLLLEAFIRLKAEGNGQKAEIDVSNSPPPTLPINRDGHSRGGQVSAPKFEVEDKVEAEVKEVHILFVGNGELEESLKSKVESLKSVRSEKTKDQSLKFGNTIVGRQSSIVNQIHFMDFQNQSQMPVVYQACDLFCLPSKGPGETWGLAINEAMAAGKAVLVSDKVGCATDLITLANGRVFKVGDLEDLISKLNEMLSGTNNKVQDPSAINGGKLKQFGAASKEMIENWSFKQQVHIFNEEIDKL